MAPEKQKRATLVRPPLWGRKPVPNTDAKVYCGPLSRPEKRSRIRGRVLDGWGTKRETANRVFQRRLRR